jgi:hypothetical protein
VPYTNRAHRVILSPTNERKLGDLGFEGFKEELGDKILGPSDPRTVRVRLIAADIIRGVYRAFPSRSRSDGDSGGDTSSAMDGTFFKPNIRRRGVLYCRPQAVRQILSKTSFNQGSRKLIFHTITFSQHNQVIHNDTISKYQFSLCSEKKTV